jgi:transketolase
MTEASNSGHPTSCSSIAELMAVLFFDKSGMHYDCKNPGKSFTSDRFVLSKGHAAPILYAAWAENGFIPKSELLNLRKIDCELEGHPTPKLPYVDVATGSLGQGLGCAAGMAYSSKYLDKLDNRYWVICGDGECAEGNRKN